jgi:hypothetical protein
MKYRPRKNIDIHVDCGTTEVFSNRLDSKTLAIILSSRRRIWEYERGFSEWAASIISALINVAWAMLQNTEPYD